MKTRELTELALLTALLVGGKEVMNALPNINPVMLFLILGVLHYGAKTFYAVSVFVAVEICLYGLGMWALNYIYIWPLFVALALPFRASHSRLFWAAFAGIYGLCFGALCAIPYFFIGGWAMALSYWVAGISFDLMHCASNFAITFVLLPTLDRFVGRLREKGEI